MARFSSMVFEHSEKSKDSVIITTRCLSRSIDIYGNEQPKKKISNQSDAPQKECKMRPSRTNTAIERLIDSQKKEEGKSPVYLSRPLKYSSRFVSIHSHIHLYQLCILFIITDGYYNGGQKKSIITTTQNDTLLWC